MDRSFRVPDNIMEALRQMGYAPDTSMGAQVQGWWEWYTSTSAFYDENQVVGGRAMHRHRLTIHPARRVCREWASLLLNDQTAIVADSDDADAALSARLDDVHLVQRGQGMVERAFALGTGAWALSFDVGTEDTAVRLRRYDARQILPLSWDEDGCSECAFASETIVRGARYSQLQVHELDMETGTYHVLTRLWRGDREHGRHARWRVRQRRPAEGGFGLPLRRCAAEGQRALRTGRLLWRGRYRRSCKACHQRRVRQRRPAPRRPRRPLRCRPGQGQRDALLRDARWSGWMMQGTRGARGAATIRLYG